MVQLTTDFSFLKDRLALIHAKIKIFSHSFYLLSYA